MNELEDIWKTGFGAIKLHKEPFPRVERCGYCTNTEGLEMENDEGESLFEKTWSTRNEKTREDQHLTLEHHCRARIFLPS